MRREMVRSPESEPVSIPVPEITNPAIIFFAPVFTRPREPIYWPGHHRGRVVPRFDPTRRYDREPEFPAANSAGRASAFMERDAVRNDLRGQTIDGADSESAFGHDLDPDCSERVRVSFIVHRDRGQFEFAGRSILPIRFHRVTTRNTDRYGPRDRQGFHWRRARHPRLRHRRRPPGRRSEHRPVPGRPCH